MGLKQDIENITIRCEKEYGDYKTQVAIMHKAYEDRRGEFDNLISTINSARLNFRKEIKGLYDFLLKIGGDLKNDNRISVFDFKDEATAPSQLYQEIPELDEPDFRKSEKWDLLWKPWLLVAIDHFKNKELFTEFSLEVEQRKSEYEKDISDRTNQLIYINDAIEIAKIYRNVIVIVCDAIQDKIIPELEFIQAFLYADSIREQILDGETVENVTCCNIIEYKGTKQDIHYQFVKNTFDFYKISTTFFKETVLTDILRDKVVTNAEKESFKLQVENIKGQIGMLEDKKVIENE